MLLNPNIPAAELGASYGEFQQTVEKIKSTSYAEPFRISAEDSEKHLEEMEKFHAEFGSRMQKLQNLITLRNLTADMGDYILGVYEEQIQSGNRRALGYWKDKKSQWLNNMRHYEAQYFAALKSLPYFVRKLAYSFSSRSWFLESSVASPGSVTMYFVKYRTSSSLLGEMSST